MSLGPYVRLASRCEGVSMMSLGPYVRLASLLGSRCDNEGEVSMMSPGPYKERVKLQ